jgi:hypothetical protein
MTSGPSANRAYNIGWNGGHILFKKGYIASSIPTFCQMAAQSLVTGSKIALGDMGQSAQGCVNGYRDAGGGQ